MNRMGACFDRLRCEVFQNLFLSPMNTGFLGSAVATVLTVYGIETSKNTFFTNTYRKSVLQQYLPFTVLKPQICRPQALLGVATVLTVYGIETHLISPYINKLLLCCNSTYRLRY